MYKVEFWFAFGGWLCIENGEFDSEEEAIEAARNLDKNNVRVVKVIAKTQKELKLEE
jgi:hypothetical protein